MPRLLDRVNAFMNPVAKAETGIGAVWMTHEMPLNALSGTPQKKMREAQGIAQSNRWIRASERVISHQFGTVPWHLETDDGGEVDDKSPEVMRAIVALLEKPYRPLEGDPITATPRTRSGLWSLTSRHMGVCGSSFWYLDAANVQTGIPQSLLYINPARMTPAGTSNRLYGWVLDSDNRGGGTPLDAKNVLHFTLEEPDDGFFPPGLVETAATSVDIVRYGDRHAAGSLASGGKLPGVFSPKSEAGILPPDVFQQLEKDLRSANEHPDASRRSVILRGPIDFTPTGATPEQLDLVAVQGMARDNILGLWGVPLSQLGIATPAGLNAGSTKSYDEAALWQKAVGPRLRRFYEVVQYQFLDRFTAQGIVVELNIEEPTFDDDMPKYELAEKAINLPLRNFERRALLGLEPFGDPKLDDAVWMPSGFLPVIPTALIDQMKGGLITTDEARAETGLAPMTYDETPSTDDLVKQLEAGLLTTDEARKAMGLAPMEWAEGLSHDEIGALIAEVEAGLLTHDEARAKLKLAPIEWTEDLSHDEVGALLAKVEAGVMTQDEARAVLKLAPMQWAESLSKEEVDTLNAQLGTGLLTIEEARAQIGRPTVTWPDDLNAKIEQAGALIRAGFDPVDVLRTLGLPAIAHLGYPPVTVQKPTDAVPGLDAGALFGDAAKARGIADLRTAATRVTPKLEKAVAAFLAEQKREVVSRIRAKSDHLAKKPGDVSVWWDAEKWDKRLAEVLEPFADQIAGMTSKHIAAMLGKE